MKFLEFSLIARARLWEAAASRLHISIILQTTSDISHRVRNGLDISSTSDDDLLSYHNDKRRAAGNGSDELLMEIKAGRWH